MKSIAQFTKLNPQQRNKEILKLQRNLAKTLEN